MMPALPRAIAFDSDNTLTASKQPIEAPMASLFAQLTLRIPTAIISGAGMPQYMSQIINHLPPETNFENVFLFPSTGASCYRKVGDTWQSLYDHCLTEVETRRIAVAIESAFNETGALHGEPKYGERLEYRGSSIAFSALGQNAPLKEKERWDPHHKKRSRVVSIIEPQLPEFEVRIGGTTTIDITRKGIDKAFAMRWFSEYLTIPLPDMLYVGDALYEDGNDAAVLTTDIRTHAVKDPADTIQLITTLLQDVSA